MAFAWPDGVQNKTKRLISQILWTLHLDFEGAIRDSRDAPMELMNAMARHGVEIKNPMTFRMILPHLDGGKYGKLITRVVIQRRTPEIRLAVRTLPEDSFLPDGAGGIATDDRIDMQLFGDTAWPARGTRDVAPTVLAREDSRDIGTVTEPARGDTRDNTRTLAEPARGDTRDQEDAARGDTRDIMLGAPENARDVKRPLADPARGEARDEGNVTLAREPARDRMAPEPSRAGVDIEDPARGDARDSGLGRNLAREEARDSKRAAELAREPARDGRGVSPQDEIDELGPTIGRLDRELEELREPLPVDRESLDPHELVDLVAGLVAELGDQVRHGPPAETSSGRDEKEWAALLGEKHELLEQVGRYLRRIKDAEARLVERNKEIECVRLQLAALNTRYERLEANNQALLAGERPAGQHLRAAQQFISAKPSDRPERGRSRPTRPNGRTTGSHSVLAYSAGGD